MAAGLVLIVIGMAALAWMGIAGAREGQVTERPAPVEAHEEAKHRLPVIPVLGVASIATGVILVALGRRR